MQQTRYVILGGGMVAGFAPRAVVEHGLEPGVLAILSADDAPPCHRPPVSKGFLAGEEEADEILIDDPGFYEERDAAPALVRAGRPVAAEALRDEDRPLRKTS